MQAYMKSTMPYHGVPAPLLRQVCKSVFADLQFATSLQWQKQDRLGAATIRLDGRRRDQAVRARQSWAIECVELPGGVEESLTEVGR